MSKDARHVAGKNNLATRLRRDMGDIDHTDRASALYKIKIQCMCPHTREDGSPALEHSKSRTSRFTSNPLFICNICKKPIDIAPISEEELDKALDVVDRMADIIKVRMSPRENTPEADKKLYHQLYKTQKFLTTKFRDMAAAARKKANKRSGNNRGVSGWRYSGGR